MQTKRTITVIGAGSEIGMFVSENLSKGNFQLLLTDNKKETIESLADNIQQHYLGADVLVYDCSVTACWEADIIIMAMPQEDEMTVIDRIKKVANQKIVIRIVQSPEMMDPQKIQRFLPYSKIFCVYVNELPGERKAFVVAGKNEVKMEVLDILSQAGLHAVEATVI